MDTLQYKDDRICPSEDYHFLPIIIYLSLYLKYHYFLCLCIRSKEMYEFCMEGKVR